MKCNKKNDYIDVDKTIILSLLLLVMFLINVDLD